MSDEIFSPIRWEQDELLLLDQTLLPAREEWLHCRRPDDVAGAIRRLSVRGAPAIGVAAAFGLVLAIDPVQAAAIMLPILIVQDIVSVWSFRHHLDWYVLGWTLPGATVGILMAIWWQRASRPPPSWRWLAPSR